MTEKKKKKKFTVCSACSIKKQCGRGGRDKKRCETYVESKNTRRYTQLLAQGNFD